MVSLAPTRRALLKLLGTSPAVLRPAPGTASPAGEEPDSFVRRSLDLDRVLARRDGAIAERDRLERDLVAAIGYPRVRLPDRPDGPPAYAAEPFDIDRALGPGRRRLRRRLKSQLRERQRAWAEAAKACGLTDAVAAEDAAFTRAEEATAALFAAPAPTIGAVRLKLTVVVAAGEPGPADRTSFPWAQLRSILADLDRLAA